METEFQRINQLFPRPAMSSSLFAIGTTNHPTSHPKSSIPQFPFPLVPIEPKVPHATDSQLPSLACLGNEIIAMIAELLQDISPQTISSLALVCSAYHRIARYAQHREVVLDGSIPKFEYIEESGMPEAIRKLVVHSNGSSIFLSQLCKLIPKMTGLKDITWSGLGVPKPVLRLLEKRPLVRLHVEVTNIWTPKTLGILAANKNLSSLKASIVYCNAEECLRWTQPLKRVVLSCPNVQKLSLDINLPQSGCTMFPLPIVYCGFGFIEGERLPILESFELNAYPFGIHVPDPLHPDNNTPYSRGYPLRVHEMEYWKDNFDWSRLQHLITCDANFALQIMPQLTSLKVFDCAKEYVPSGKMLKIFRLIPSSLESINVSKITDIGVENLLRHGNTLRDLTIHQEENYEGEWRVVTINADTLIQIRDGCPHIEELSLDVSRIDDWPYEILDILASFSSLRSLTIWFELGITDCDQPIQPYVNFSAAGKLFKYIHEHATSQNTRLRKVTFMSGSPPKFGIGLPSKATSWASCNSSIFVCELSDRDDHATKGIFDVKCPGLTRDENEYLRRFDSGEKHIGILLYLQESLLVARDGPTPLLEWGRGLSWY